LSFNGFAFAVPISAMSRDDGDVGDRPVDIMTS
jgi:hypothetical protein